MPDLYELQVAPHNLVKAEVVASDILTASWQRFDAAEDGEDDVADLSPADSLRAARGGRQPAGAGYGLDQIMSEAEGILREAQDEADRLLQDARVKLQSERDRVFQQAIEQARAEVNAQADPGRDQAADDLRQATVATARLVEQLQEAWRARLSEIEESLLDTAFEIARKVVDREIATHPEVVIESVREALGRLASGELTVKLNPADLPLVQSSLLELQAERSVGDMLSFEEDPRIERGGCVVIGDNGSVDTQPSSKLEKLKNLAEG